MIPDPERYPIEVFTTAMIGFEQGAGQWPTRLVLDPRLYASLCDHEDVAARLRYSTLSNGVTPEVIAAIVAPPSSPEFSVCVEDVPSLGFRFEAA